MIMSRFNKYLSVDCCESKAKEDIIDISSQVSSSLNLLTPSNSLKSLFKSSVTRAPTSPISKDHPISKKLSRLNGEINRMSFKELEHNLKAVGLEETGSIESFKKRLKNYYKNEEFTKVLKKKINYCYDVICVVDYEATCERDTNKDFKQEIIEFPAFLINVNSKKIVSTFHEYVRPVLNPILTKFCTELTGIEQDTVDKADTFPNVLDRFETWFYNFLRDNNCHSFAMATDGPWDMAHFFPRQCELNKISFPSYCKRWINIRKVFSSHYKTQHLCLNQMLTHLGIEFQGRRHSGYDDALNIANILIRMLVDGANPVVNERISWHQVNRTCWNDLRCGYVRVFYDKPSDGLNVSDSEDPLEDDEDDD